MSKQMDWQKQESGSTGCNYKNKKRRTTERSKKGVEKRRKARKKQTGKEREGMDSNKKKSHPGEKRTKERNTRTIGCWATTSNNNDQHSK